MSDDNNKPLLPEMFATPPREVRKSGAYRRLSKLMSIDMPLTQEPEEQGVQASPVATHPGAEKYLELARKARKRGDRHSAAIYEHQARLAQQQTERQDDSQDDDEQPEQQESAAEPEPSIFDDIPEARRPSPGGNHPRAPGRRE